MPTPSPARFERIAHRGMPLERPENTLSGFQLAVARGAEGVELDTHTSSDGVVVVHHDALIGRQAIATTPWRELREMIIAGDETIPRLEDVLQALGDRATVYIEIKGASIEDAVIAVARQHGRRFALHSFDHAAIGRVAAAAPDMARGILLDRDTSAPTDAMRRAADTVRPRDVWPHWSLVDEPFMHAARALGVRVIPWTVNSVATARHLAQLGVDGICTDDVGILATL